ncbi:MAG TPA: DinB family protein [Candidatus Limnocylindria bacterium]|nr:DinB family protein [Candidatus Limnocylindria bacterium]
MQVDAARPAAATPQWRDSLERRVAAVHALWQLGVADLTAEQVNHFERPGVLPIAFTLLHCVVGEDRNVARYLIGGEMLWDAQGWTKRVGLVGEPPQRGTPMADAERVRIADLDAWREYQRAAFARTESALAELPLERFGAKAMDRPPADKLKGAFLGLLVPASSEILVADVCEAYIFQHAARHLGELEHARALVGLGGLS